MATKTPQANASGHSTTHDTEHAFPSELPPRNYKTTWMQRHGFNWRSFFSMHYRSFSLLHLPNARTRWRRMSMWVIQALRFALSVILIMFTSWQYPNRTAYAVGVSITSVLGFVLLLFNAWCLAVIDDAVGWRRVVGVTVVSFRSFGRMIEIETDRRARQDRLRLDLFVYVMAACHLVLAATYVFWYGWAFAIVWLVVQAIIFGVALMASKHEEG